jgi:hypothetical protein
MKLSDPHGNNWKMGKELNRSPLFIQHLRNHFADIYFDFEKENEYTNIIQFHKSA